MKNRNINIGLIWANPYTENLGVTALAFSSLFLFEKIAKAKNLKFNYFILSSNGPRNDSFQIGEYKVDIINLPWNYNGSFKSLIKLVLINWYQVLSLFKFDVAFDIGAGDSFSDIYGIKRFREINAIKNILQILGKKIILLPQTYGPFNSLEANKKATISIKKANLVLARDTQSYNYIKNLIPNQKIVESIDVAFFMPYNKQKLNNNAKLKIGINISGLLWNGGYTNDNQFQLKANYQDLMQKIILHFLKKPDVEIYFIAHVLLKDYENIENDYKICYELNHLYPTTILAPFFTNPIEAKSFIGSLDFFIGARMHACIAAFSTGVPVFPLAYSRKFNGLFGDTLNYKYYGDLVASDIDDVLNDLKSAFRNRKVLKEIIEIAQNTLSHKESELINLLSDAITESK
jgi:polysaccharide pyruvyl transferase WcaK-like protein